MSQIRGNCLPEKNDVINVTNDVTKKAFKQNRKKGELHLIVILVKSSIKNKYVKLTLQWKIRLFLKS